jgi:ectoine hydroxylase-related dioxygenase (phytanoyl-CoA dioxygenase family)
MKFGWHQDSGYVGYPHKPYLTCWCTLDDVNEENGSVYILPYSRAGVREIVKHSREEGTNDLIGYFGDDPGLPVIAPAGSIAVFSSVCFHRSGPNRTSKMRRIYLPQYSAEPILSEDGAKLRAFAEAFLKDGQIVATARFEGDLAPVTQRSTITNR